MKLNLSKFFQLRWNVFLFTAHWGAVEFIPWVLAMKGYPVSVILECQTPHLAKSLKKRAATFGADLISSADGQSVYGRALDSLQSTRLLMTECDEVDAWRKKRVRTIRLFDKTLFFDNTLDLMAQRSGAPVVGIFLKRVSLKRFTLICEPINNGRGANRTAARALHLWQKYVTRFPEQWYQWKKWAAMKVA
jgi:lauroyl/myristoyl acyltransferase